jgi:UDP-2-acetamido-2-deoxy-ribo-hexuluronate aminotransferase
MIQHCLEVPFVDLKRYEDGFVEGWLSDVDRLTKTASFVGGPDVEIFEKHLCALTGGRYVVSCANGTDALQLALRAVGVGLGDTVVTQQTTFWATLEAIYNVGATPILVDSDLKDLNVSARQLIEEAERQKPKAVVVAHIYGWCSEDLDLIRTYCRGAGVPLVEDGAQAIGVKLDGRSIFEDSFISTLSFYPAKVLGAAGDGGAVIVSNESLANHVRSLANHGRSKHYEHKSIGWNSRLDSLQAAFLNRSIGFLDARIASRRRSAQVYADLLRGLEGFIRVVSPSSRVLDNGYLNVCLLEEPGVRSDLIGYLKSARVGSAVVYPAPVGMQPCDAIKTIRATGSDGANRISESVLSLPLFPYMREDELDYIAGLVIKFFKGGR